MCHRRNYSLKKKKSTCAEKTEQDTPNAREKEGVDLLRQTAVVSGGMGVRPAEVVLCGDSLLRGACVRGLFDL